MTVVPCEHKQIIINPKVAVRSKDQKGVVVRGLKQGEVYCRRCHAQLPNKVIGGYDQKNVFVGVPVTLFEDK